MTARSETNRDITLNMRVARPIKEMIVALAKADDRSIGNMVEHLIRDAYTRNVRRAKARRA